MAHVPDAIAVPLDGLVLRRLQLSDLDRLVAAAQRSHPELRKWMEWAAEPVTPESVRSFLEQAEADAASQTDMVFGLVEPDGDLVGGCGLHARRGPGILEIGYWVRTDRTGRGYATAAARALTGAAFDCFPHVDRVEIRCDPANAASAAIPPKLGYRLDGEEPAPIVAADQTGRQLVWAVARAAWPPTPTR